MMGLIRIIKSFSASGLIFAFFIAAVFGVFFLYNNNSHKLKLVQIELTKSQEENKSLKAQTGELYNQLDTQAKKSRELSNELLQLSEEKTQCYKNIVRHHEKLKKISVAAPNRVELLVNNYFIRMFNDVAKATGTR